MNPKNSLPWKMQKKTNLHRARLFAEAHMRTNHISNSMKSDSSVSPKISVSWKQ